MFFRKNYIGLEELLKQHPKDFTQQAIIIILKLLISEYTIKNNCIIVKLKNNYLKLNNSDTPGTGVSSQFWNSYFFTDNIYNHFLNNIKDVRYSGNLIGALNDFSDKFIVQGKNPRVKNTQFYKLYFTKKPHNVCLSNELGRSWIDYDKQLKKRKKIIYDSNRDTVIWGMNPQYKNQMVNSKLAIERYGNNLLTIETLPKEKYVLFDEEIIGKRFKVVNKTNLHNNSNKI